MEDLDFVTAPEKKTVYDPDVARAFFRSCGTPVKAVKGTTLFAEQSQGDKMYFIAAGEVTISVGGKNIDVTPTGEIIGEMSAITGTPRAATGRAQLATASLVAPTKSAASAFPRAPSHSWARRTRA